MGKSKTKFGGCCSGPESFWLEALVLATTKWISCLDCTLSITTWLLKNHQRPIEVAAIITDTAGSGK